MSILIIGPWYLYISHCSKGVASVCPLPRPMSLVPRCRCRRRCQCIAFLPFFSLCHPHPQSSIVTCVWIDLRVIFLAMPTVCPCPCQVIVHRAVSDRKGRKGEAHFQFELLCFGFFYRRPLPFFPSSRLLHVGVFFFLPSCIVVCVSSCILAYLREIDSRTQKRHPCYPVLHV